jgi:2-polyprenyl-3-methyl-5-hydroxy-6-metoxy-1,4-benzoquinol methylase
METNELVKVDKIDEWAWFKGYFSSSHDNWDGLTYKRNFNELYLRDLSVSTLGDVKNKRILDVGCGWGLYTLTFARLGAHAYGQDLSVSSINTAKTLMEVLGLNVTYKIGDVKSLSFEDNYFDAIFSGDFFEHISEDDKNLVFQEIYRVLKPNGVFTIKTPNLAYLQIALWYKKIRAILSGKSPFDMYVAHTHNNPDCEHHGLISHRALENLLVKNKFQFVEVTKTPLIRPGLPLWLGGVLSKFKIFNEHIIVTCKKPIFFGFWP